MKFFKCHSQKLKDDKVICLQDKFTDIGPDVFDGFCVEYIVLADTTKAIRNYAFAGTGKCCIYLPKSITEIEPFAFENISSETVFYCVKGSYAEEVCLENKLTINYDTSEIHRLVEEQKKQFEEQRQLAEAQRKGGEAAFIDAEHALDPVYAKNLGVDIDNLIVSQPDTGEQALEIAEALVRSGALDVVVIDSVAALVPKAEIEGEMGSSHVGLLARLMSQALRKLTGITSKSGTAVIFINQIREKVGVVYGNPETTPGGRALKFFSSVRLEVRRQEAIKNGTEIIGNKTKVKVVKNKVAPPFKEAEFDIMYGEGISKLGNIIDVAVSFDIIKKSGAWFSYDGERLGQGRDNVKKYMEENPDFTQMIEQKVRLVLSGKGEDVVENHKNDE